MPLAGFRIEITQNYDDAARLQVLVYQNTNWSITHTGHVDANDLSALIAGAHSIAPGARLDIAVQDIVTAVTEKQEARVDKLLAELEKTRDIQRVYR